MLLFIVLAITSCGKKEYTVTFDSNGGKEFINEIEYLKGKEFATEPASPTKNGYKFLYWELDNEEYLFDTKVTKDITLVAKWKSIIDTDIYTMVSETFLAGKDQIKVFIYKNDKIVRAFSVLNKKEEVIATYNEEYKVIVVDKNDYPKITKAKLDDGTIVDID